MLSAAVAGMHFDVTDARGKKPGGVAIEIDGEEEAGWYQLKVVSKSKGIPVLIWPFDGRAKAPDGPGEIPVIVVEAGDARVLTNARAMAAIAASELLDSPHATGLDGRERADSLAKLTASEDPFVKGVGLLYAKKPSDAVDWLAKGLRERERQLTRVPSEIYPAAVLYGRALLEAQKFDEAAVAFLKALKQRPADPVASRLRAEALAKAGKPEAQ